MIDDDPPFSTIESRIFEKSEKSARVYNKSVQLRINERRIREEVEVMEFFANLPLILTREQQPVHSRREIKARVLRAEGSGDRAGRRFGYLGAGGWRDRTWPPTLTFALGRRERWCRRIACARNVPSRPTLVGRPPRMWSTV